MFLLEDPGPNIANEDGVGGGLLRQLSKIVEIIDCSHEF